MMSVPAPTKGHKIFRVPLHNVLRSVSNFKSGFEDLTLEWKSMLLIADIGTDLSQISLDIHKYNSDLDAVLLPTLEFVNSPEGTPPPGARAYAAFMDVANKTEIACKKAVNKEEKVILEEWAKKTMELLRGIKFPPRGFKLDYQRVPPMVAEVANMIDQKYGGLSMRAKTKFYAE